MKSFSGYWTPVRLKILVFFVGLFIFVWFMALDKVFNRLDLLLLAVGIIQLQVISFLQIFYRLKENIRWFFWGSSTGLLLASLIYKFFRP